MIEELVGKIYESRLKTRKQVPTSETMKIISIIQSSKDTIYIHFVKNEVKGYLQPIMKMLIKNYFGYLLNLDARGKSQLKWFLSELKDILCDIFGNEIREMEKKLWNK